MWKKLKKNKMWPLKKIKFDNTQTQNVTILKTQNVTTQIFDMWQNS